MDVQEPIEDVGELEALEGLPLRSGTFPRGAPRSPPSKRS